MSGGSEKGGPPGDFSEGADASFDAPRLGDGSFSPSAVATRPVERGLAAEFVALKALSNQRGVPGIDLSQVCIKLADLESIPRDIALAHKLLPVLAKPDRLFVAMANPEDRKVLEELEFVTGKLIFAYIGLESALVRTIREAYDARDRGEEHYVAPSCPAELLVRAGLDPVRFGRERPASSGEAAPTEATRALEERLRPDPTHPASSRSVVVDDRLERAEPTPMDESEFGAPLQVSERLSGSFPPPKPADPQGRRKLLVVDDEADIRRLMRKVLEDRGHIVVEADRGRLALQLVKLETPDLIVLDAMLPEVHGFDIARRIRSSTRYAHIPIVMVSAVYRGWRFAEDARQTYGVDAYLEKPFKVQELVDLIERALEARRGEPQVDAEHISAEAEFLVDQGVAAYRAGDMDEAVDALERALALDPLAYRVHFHLGLLYGKRGQVYDAIERLERAVELNASHYTGLKNLAILYQQAGFRNKALEAWERALCFAPDTKTRDAIKEHIVSLL